MAKLTSFITTQSSRGENRENKIPQPPPSMPKNPPHRKYICLGVGWEKECLKTMKIIQNVIKSIMKIINLLNDRIDRRRCSKLLHAMPSP